ncbi:MAG: hypothetical protein NTU73_07810 [Ignavibacteriae bacterium]|nr:hypothetical protein [Ignavibacteriota bacterium]
MKRAFILFAAMFLFATNSGFSQQVSLNPNSLPIITNNDFGVACSGGHIHDDGVAENGYGWNASAGDKSGFCAKFIPTSYPYKFTKFCLALTRLAAGPANFTFTITMWKSVNGMPGVVMATTTVTATGVPVWTSVTIFDFNLPASWANVTGTDSVYIGIMYTVTTQLSVFVGSDESTTTPIWDAWATTAAGPWQRPAVLWTTYRSLIFRAEGQSAGPLVIHTPLPNTQNIAGPYIVNCVVTPAGNPISSTKLYWSRNNPTVTDSVTMTNSSGTNWTGNIPGNSTNATYRYYIKAIDAVGLVGTHPSNAPASLNTFTANSTDTTKPVIVHTPIGNTPKALWPIHCIANVTDNIGIDSVWVRWYKNTTANYKQFKLLLTTGSIYDAIFNSVNADVVAGDVIYYRIIAQDASAQHNKDSTTLYNFNIIALVTVCIGTGTTPSNYPYTTYWMDGRTQMLFTSAELIAGGAGPNMQIDKLGFTVITVGGPAMAGFNVRFQHTTATSLTGWVTSGWTTAYSGTYAPPAPGLQYIDMQAPYFIYNGTSNLLVEICYDNSAYTAYSPVNSTAAAGMTYGYYTDNIVGCTATAGDVQATRPNACFIMEPATGTSNNHSYVPTKYALNQNYPNPFNPVTRINFEIPKQGLVSLKVYDVLGREDIQLTLTVLNYQAVFTSIDSNQTDLQILRK